MNVTLSLDDDLVKKVRKIAVDRDTTLTGMVRDYLTQVADEADTKQHQIQALERSFRTLRVKVGKITWTRDELHERG